MRLEIINGVKYINGYLCDSSGRPITINNGYSSEDEQFAREAYIKAREKKYNTKQPLPKAVLLKDEEERQNRALEEYYKNEEKGYKMVNGCRVRNGKLLNDLGQEISIENGYSSEDEKFAMEKAKDF